MTNSNQFSNFSKQRQFQKFIIFFLDSSQKKFFLQIIDSFYLHFLSSLFVIFILFVSPKKIQIQFFARFSSSFFAFGFLCFHLTQKFGKINFNFLIDFSSLNLRFQFRAFAVFLFTQAIIFLLIIILTVL